MVDKAFQDTINTFDVESSKLEKAIHEMLKRSEKLSVKEIVEVYYQVINLSSMTRFFRQLLENNDGKEQNTDLENKTNKVDELIANYFNEKLHPLVISQLTDSISELMKNLKVAKKGMHGKRTKEEIEEESKIFETLREVMSTKEFVEQYQKGLKND